MYEYIKGTIVSASPAEVILENNGIGYRLEISLNTYSKLQGIEQCTLYIYHLVREDIQQFYGFFDKSERELFLLLISVSGVGPNTARMMLSSMTQEELTNAILTNDVNRIKGTKGVGLKTAQKIIIDLKDKIGKTGSSADMLPLGDSDTANIREEAVSALIMLGFVKAAVEKTVSSLMRENPKHTVESLIKAALKRL